MSKGAATNGPGASGASDVGRTMPHATATGDPAKPDAVATRPMPGPGRVRPVRRTILIGLATIGVGYVWYYFIAFRELDFWNRRRHSALIFLMLLPILGPMFGVMYVSKELRKLHLYRQERALAPSLTPVAHFWWMALALTPALVAIIVLANNVSDESPWWWLPIVLAGWAPTAVVPRLAQDINSYWKAVELQTGAKRTAPPKA